MAIDEQKQMTVISAYLEQPQNRITGAQIQRQPRQYGPIPHHVMSSSGWSVIDVKLTGAVRPHTPAKIKGRRFHWPNYE